MPHPSPTLSITDNRTGWYYEVPISHNAVDATAFQAITEHPGALGTTGNQGAGLLVIDEGYRNTAPVQSKISHLDPNKGTLQYRQYPISELFGNYTFEECTHLLVWGCLPSSAQREALRHDLASALQIPPEVFQVIRAFPRHAPTMTIIMAGLSAWASSDPASIPVVAGKDVYGDPSIIDQNVSRTLGALGAIVAVTHCHQHDTNFQPAKGDQTFVENLLFMMGYTDEETQRPEAKQVSSLEKLLLLHAEHGMCNATAAFLHCASTHADPISCLIAALVAIYGPLHGGSNIMTYKQLQSIGSVENVPALIDRVITQKQRLFGFGHRIYNTVDPRATILRDWIQESRQDARIARLLDVASELDKVSTTNSFFTKRKLQPNTDLYTVLAYQAIGLPEELVFPMICISRAQGFLAHWREFMSASPPTWRPQQIYIGHEAGFDKSSKL